MMNKGFISLIILLGSAAFIFMSGRISDEKICSPGKTIIKGLSFVAPPNPFTNNPFVDINHLEANFISVIPYAFMRQDDPNVYYHYSDKRWWGETPEGVKESIHLAHQHGVKVMLKPSVWVHRKWTGDIYFEDKDAADTWKKTYRQYIIDYAHMADSLEVDLFCIGNEFKKFAINDPDYWYQLIHEIREVYSGKLTYASNWDAYDHVEFWNALDYIGINAYFPLSSKKDVTKKELITSWKPIEVKIDKTAKAYNKPVLFTEYGYLSVDGATHNTWELERRLRELPVNETVQSNAFDALYSVFWEKDYWQGGFIWKWYPYERRRQDYHMRDYTPQGKLSEVTIRNWFQKESTQ